ncbi:MAG TPA: ThuA domain-containing protein [Candidatus Paceibacterota bacterium]|nr:ThuA domain-containing protein [Verrucomicrobiota bacterium]HOX04375.1 ThuA domain-containing protein [Verrucomicrobiota bacterium]HRZ47273.1 ThuA domain-containing protein [Candidatus Paceibacterota bacterium]HRZ92701.1 ThuA domain-containing protein [Candidatus Paceibacterota bacterium]
MKTIVRAAAGLVLACGLTALGADKKIVLIGGGPSHGPGDHEHRAGCMLLQRCLNQMPGVRAEVHQVWPDQFEAFDGAAAVFIFSDGGGGHPAIQEDRLEQLRRVMARGTGLGCMHYAVEVPKEKGGPEWLAWIGGYFETYWSVNPFWTADFKELPVHPITRGVKPFQLRDEWYYHMRFAEGMKGVTPILTAVPPESTRGKPGVNLPHGGNPHVQARKGMPEHLMWAFERPDGGRGFGCTGGHSHVEWGEENFRKVILNAILWSARIEVPEQGADCPVTPEILKENLDRKGRR